MFLSLLLALQAAIEMPQVSEPAEPATYPGSWVTTDDYPVASLRRGEEGTTGFRLHVGSDGRVISCEITETSGFPRLDEQTCMSLKVRARFRPAKDMEGMPTEDMYSNSVR